MKKILALVFALIVATVAFGVTASAVEVTQPEIPTVTMPELPTQPEIPTITMPEVPAVTSAEIPTATKPEIHTLQEIPTVTTPEIPTATIPEFSAKPETTEAVDTEIPSTGSGVIAPVIALLAFAGGAVIAVKAKKED